MRALRPLIAVPATIPALLTVVVMAVWAATEAGYPITDWYPGALVILALTTVAVVALRPSLRAVPRLALVAGALLGAYTLWSYASIAWADSQGDAWEGANRTLLYLVVFVLFALWAQRAGTAAVVLGAWTLVISVVAVGTLLDLSGTAQPLGKFIGGRLSEPAGYPNAEAAMFLMALWPAVLLAGRREVSWWWRGLFAAGAVALADTALMAQSRGAIFSVPIVVIAFFVFVPGRVRSFAAAVPVAIAVGLTAPGVLDVEDRLSHGAAAGPLVRPILLAAVLVGLVVAFGAWVDAARIVRETGERRIHRGLGAAGIAVVVAVLVGGLVVAGNPVQRLSDGWDSFKGGYSENPGGKSRLVTGLGSNRYDFYRVAVSNWKDHPLVGVGADNFAQDYLVHGHSEETPRYPHSLELRTLSQTGVVGALLLLGAFAAGLAGALRAMRRADGLAAAVAGGAAMVFVYWTVHGSFDWFWEFAGLGSAAWAMLGLACALAPRDSAEEERVGARAASGRRPVALAGAIAAGVVALAAALSLALPWISERDVTKAAHDWPADPAAAFDRLDSAATLNPLSDRPQLIGGTIALRMNDLGRARQEFADAHDRNPRGATASLELGAIESSLGRRAPALALLEGAARLAPRDPAVRQALDQARSGRRVDIEAINGGIRRRAERLVH